jgi:hypothetical protein
MIISDVEQLIRQKPGMTATAIARALFGDDGYNQRVNTECLALVFSGRVERRGEGGPSDPYTYYSVKL